MIFFLLSGLEVLGFFGLVGSLGFNPEVLSFDRSRTGIAHFLRSLY